MKNKLKFIIIPLIISVSLISGCAEEIIPEEAAPDNINIQDEVFSSDFRNMETVSDFIPMPDCGEVLYSACINNELIIRIRADEVNRFEYENKLFRCWYKNIPLDVSMNDRISTWLHPTGWRIAIYDNKRNKNLRSLYGTEDYIYELRIKKLIVLEGTFPEYPEADKPLGLEYIEYDISGIDLKALLPEGFLLPEYKEVTRVWQDDTGLFIQFATTYQDFDEYYRALNGSELLHGSTGCYVNENGDYFYLGVSPLYDTEVSRLELSYEESELMTSDGKAKTPALITLQLVKRDWLPSWWLELKANS